MTEAASAAALAAHPRVPIHKPPRFEYRTVHPANPLQWSVWSRRFGQQGGPWVRLGSVAFAGSDEDAEDRGWLARHALDDAFEGPFESLAAATTVLWRRHLATVDAIGRHALLDLMAGTTPDDPAPPPPPGRRAHPVAEAAAPAAPETEFRALARRAGLSLSDATRVAGPLNLKTGRRWARGTDYDGTPIALPQSARALLTMVAEEHEKALLLEDAGHGEQPRPIRDRLLADARAREQGRRDRREAEGKARDPQRGHGPVRKASREAALGRKEGARAAALEELLGPGAAGGGQG